MELPERRAIAAGARNDIDQLISELMDLHNSISRLPTEEQIPSIQAIQERVKRMAKELEPDEEFIPDEDGSEAFGRMLERRAEAGTWWGR